MVSRLFVAVADQSPGLAGNGINDTSLSADLRREKRIGGECAQVASDMQTFLAVSNKLIAISISVDICRCWRVQEVVLQ